MQLHISGRARDLMPAVLIAIFASLGLLVAPSATKAATHEATACGGGQSNDADGQYCSTVTYVGYPTIDYNFSLRFPEATEEFSSATLYLYASSLFGGGTDVNVYVGKRVITSSATWNKYDGSSSWGTAGGRGSSDRGSFIGSGTISSSGWVAIPLSATTTAAMFADGVRALHIDVANRTGNHRVTIDFDSSKPYIDLATPEEDPPFTVSEGGTGATNFVTNGVLLGNGTSTIQVSSAGSAYQVFRVPSGGGAPSFGALDLSQSAAVAGVLPVANGGTGVSSTTPGAVLFGGASGFAQDSSQFFWDDTSHRLGLGTSSPVSQLDVNGTSAAKHFKGTGSSPTIEAGTCAGTGASASVTGKDTGGKISLTSGTSPAAGETCLTLTFAEPYASTPHVIFSPANSGAALLSGVNMVYSQISTSTFRLTSGIFPIAPSMTYEWEYYVVE